MCNLYANMTSQQAMRQLFQVRPEFDGLGNAAPQLQIKPDNQVPIVRVDREGNRAIAHARWGYRKVKFKGQNFESWLTNTRDLTAPVWKRVLQEPRQRCLVPASSFAEYHPTEKFMGKAGKPNKCATWFRLIGDEDRPPFAFAGFVRRWNWEKDGLRRKADADLAAENAQVIAMTFLTTEANSIVAPIHPKAMPVILRTEEEFSTWLHGSGEEAAALQRPLPDDALEIAFIGVATCKHNRLDLQSS